MLINSRKYFLLRIWRGYFKSLKPLFLADSCLFLTKKVTDCSFSTSFQYDTCSVPQRKIKHGVSQWKKTINLWVNRTFKITDYKLSSEECAREHNTSLYERHYQTFSLYLILLQSICYSEYFNRFVGVCLPIMEMNMALQHDK